MVMVGIKFSDDKIILLSLQCDPLVGASKGSDLQYTTVVMYSYLCLT